MEKLQNRGGGGLSTILGGEPLKNLLHHLAAANPGIITEEKVGQRYAAQFMVGRAHD